MKRFTFIVLMLTGTVAWANAPARVLLLPFESVGPVEKDWVAKALQQNLVAELARVNSVQAVTGNRAASAMDDALKAADEAHADYVVFGSYQAVDGDLRMTGQVIDVSKKLAVAGLKTTGSQRDLFGMEDVIAHQIKRALPQPVVEAHPEMLQQPPAAPPPAIEPNGPVVINDANLRAQDLQDQIDRAIDRIRFAPPDYYDYYPSSYGYFPYYSSVYYVPVFGHHHHDHHNWGGTSISGSYHSEHFNGSFRIGGGTGGHNHAAPVGNFVSSGRNFVQATAGNSMGARR